LCNCRKTQAKHSTFARFAASSASNPPSLAQLGHNSTEATWADYDAFCR